MWKRGVYDESDFVLHASTRDARRQEVDVCMKQPLDMVLRTYGFPCSCCYVPPACSLSDTRRLHAYHPSGPSHS
eukprot:6186707-Pleurochrysis_carterae.AAC.5